MTHENYLAQASVFSTDLISVSFHPTEDQKAFQNDAVVSPWKLKLLEDIHLLCSLEQKQLSSNWDYSISKLPHAAERKKPAPAL